jgi:hypothetical protein
LNVGLKFEDEKVISYVTIRWMEEHKSAMSPGRDPKSTPEHGNRDKGNLSPTNDPKKSNVPELKVIVGLWLTDPD